ncbi:transposase DNA-binding-containing protein [Bradyrhizobium sp. USDA 336]|uniref:transposase DNA-binding-containing protein n=1 Tax=Bradyrhizobium sp. USDA 336 TaxID=3156311 RepID=UPI00384EE30E
MQCESWIDRESGGCDFRNARLGDRFDKLLTDWKCFGQSIPLVCQIGRIPGGSLPLLLL